MADEKKKKPKISLSSLAKDAAIPLPATGAPKPTFEVASERGTPVRNSPDLQRILALPRRPVLDLKSARAEALVELMTERYSNGKPAGDCQCKQIDPTRQCITSLLPVQAWALYEAGLVGGMFGGIVVGGGKTILDLLLIYPLGVKKALALIPSNLVTQLWDDYRLLSQHFRVPSITIEGLNRSEVRTGEPMLYVMAYGGLSRPGQSAYIDVLKPEAVISDECDKLADLEGSATARRAFRYAVENPNTKFAGMTGSPTNAKISEYSHLMAWALKFKSPVPLDPEVVKDWGAAIDVSEMRSPPGALRALMQEGDTDVRQGYYRRLSETLGVIMTSDDEVERSDENGIIVGTRVEQVVHERPAPVIPPRVLEALKSARAFVRKDTMFGARRDEELETPVEKARAIREIISGVSYVWEFPPIKDGEFTPVSKGGTPQEEVMIEDWYDYRAAWNKAVRSQCILGVRHLDSPKLCEDAAKRYHGDLPIPPCPSDVHPDVWAARHPVWPCPAWPDWRDIRDRVFPKPVVHRLDPYLAEDAAAWAHENTRPGASGIVWYDLVEFGQWVAEIAELPLHGGGPKALQRIKAETGDRSIIASISSHGRGRDGLQRRFSTQLVTQIPSSAKRWEQLLGRLLRRGQKAEEVSTWLYGHIPELKAILDQAQKYSGYVEDSLRMKQKLLTGLLRSKK